MLRSSRKPYRLNQSYRSSRKSNQRKSVLLHPWMILAAIPLSLIALELAMRLFVFATGEAAKLQAYEGEAPIVNAYRLKYLDRAGQSYDGLPNRGRLQVQRSSFMGYRLVENQTYSPIENPKNPVWNINAQGFRADQPIPQAKPADEVRIFVLGGSTAFGQMSSSNKTTFASQLEDRFNQQIATQKRSPAKFRPDVLPYFADELVKAMALPPRIRESKYRVVNAAVPGYASSNELAQLSHQVLSYKPDFIVLVDGYADLLLPSQQEGAEIPGIEALLANASGHLSANLSHQFKDALYQSFLIRGFQYWVLRPHESMQPVIPPTADPEVALTQRLPADAAELERRTARYRTNLQQIARITTAAKVPLIVALQPEITSRPANNLSPREQKIVSQLDSGYKEKVKAGYSQLGQVLQQVKQEFPTGVTTLNLYDAYANFKGEAFQDTVHLTDEANTKLSDRLYDSIANSLLLQPKPYGESGTPPQ